MRAGTGDARTREHIGLAELVHGPGPDRAGVDTPLMALHAQESRFRGRPRDRVGTAASIYGLPDAGLLTLPELVDNVRRVAAAVRLPTLVDAEDGYGDVLNVVRTGGNCAGRAAVGFQLEDQATPRRCGQHAGWGARSSTAPCWSSS